MHYLVQKMSLSHQSKVDNSDSANINVLSQGTVDNCTTGSSADSRTQDILGPTERQTKTGKFVYTQLQCPRTNNCC
jgi:hypothetical protein